MKKVEIAYIIYVIMLAVSKLRVKISYIDSNSIL